MKSSLYKSYDELPLFLNSVPVAKRWVSRRPAHTS